MRESRQKDEWKNESNSWRIDIRFQEPLKHYTFTKVGGNAEF